MDQRRYRFALWTIPVVFVGVFLALLNAQYPLIGQDYFYFFPRILSGTWHFAHAGFAPFRYDPHFCGGLGHYGNPQDVSFSMLQLFGMTTDLWTAVQMTLSLMILAGYIGWYRVGRDVMALNNEWSHALATITSASGYYILHMVLGHMTFHTTTLLGWFVWLVFADATLLTSWKTRAALTALLSAFILHAGGYFVLMQCALMIALMLPFALAPHEAPLARAKELAMRLGIMCVAALLACASKLVAIASYMQIFPRTLPFYPYVGDDPIPLFVAKALWMVPQHLFAFGTQPYAAGLHEFSMQISPVTLLGVIALPFFLWHTRAMLRRSQWIFIAIGMLLITIITYGFVKGDGATADLFQRLPILSSWRMNMRFLYVTSVLVAIGGTFGFAWLAKRRLSESRAAAVAIGSSILTIIAFYDRDSCSA